MNIALVPTVPVFLISLGHSSRFLAHSCPPHFPYCWVVLIFTVLCNNFFGDGIHNAVGKISHVYVVVVGETGWACCDELVECSDSLIISVVDVIRHQVDCLLQYHVGCCKWDSRPVGCGHQ